MSSLERGLVFGGFPLGVVGGPHGIASGPPDDLEQIGRALRALQGDGAPLLIRWYVWSGAASTGAALDHVAQLVSTGVALDLVLCYRDPSGDVSAGVEFVASVMTELSHQLAALQVTGANLIGFEAAADGSTPRAVEALVGVNVTHWELSTLRDTDSARDDVFHQFGVLHDDYSPKLVFEALCALLSELRGVSVETPAQKR